MERLKRRTEETENALRTLHEILEQPYSVVVRDATIQRFEYTFESFWKFVKEYLRQHEGIVCDSPKSCFRGALSAGLVTEEQAQACLGMTDNRNLTSHTYIEAVAEKVYQLAGQHCQLMFDVFTAVNQRLKEGESP